MPTLKIFTLKQEALCRRAGKNKSESIKILGAGKTSFIKVIPEEIKKPPVSENSKIEVEARYSNYAVPPIQEKFAEIQTPGVCEKSFMN